MDGAWALYEAWVRLQHGDIDSALVFSSGISSRGELREVLCLQNDPVLPDAALGRPRVARRAPGPGPARRGQADRGRPRRGGGAQPPERRSATRSRRSAATSPPRTCSPSRRSWRRSAPATARRSPTGPPRWCSWPATGPARCASARRGSAGSTTASSRTTRASATSPRASRPGWPASTSGVGDAPDRGGRAVRHLQPRGADPAGRPRAGRRRRGQPVRGRAGRQPRSWSPGSSASARRSGRSTSRGSTRTLGHATSGPCLQQNLVCLLEGSA